MEMSEIDIGVKNVLVDALGVEFDEIHDDSKLMNDLGAESIDFLDIVFRLEKIFAIKLPRIELIPARLQEEFLRMELEILSKSNEKELSSADVNRILSILFVNISVLDVKQRVEELLASKE